MDFGAAAMPLDNYDEVVRQLDLMRRLRDGEIGKGRFAERWPCSRQQAHEFETLVDMPIHGWEPGVDK